MSTTSARHRKPSARRAGGRRPPQSKHNKPPAARLKPAPVVAIASTAVVVGAAAVAIGFAWQAHPAAPGRLSELGGTAGTADAAAVARQLPDGQLAAALVQAGVKLHTLTPTPAPDQRPTPNPRPTPNKSIKAIKPAAKPQLTPRPKPVKPAPGPPPVYLNPLRAIAGLLAERIDMGADFGGSGPIYAIGDAVVTNATGTSAGWPGGGWITYQLTDGPAAGLQVYVAEDVTPAVQVGDHVTSKTIVAHMYNGGAGIETGWAHQRRRPIPVGCRRQLRQPARSTGSAAG